MKKIDPSRLAVKPPDPYLFKSSWKRLVAGWMDALFRPVAGSQNGPIDWAKVERVAVLRLDHLGDVLLALPVLEALRQSLPKAKIDIWVGPWGREAALMSRSVDEVRVFDAPWFARPFRKGTWKGIGSLSDSLREKSYDGVIDLRGDLRHHLAAWRAKVPVRIGPTPTGGKPFLTHTLEYPSELHEVERNLNYLRQVGLTGTVSQAWGSLRWSPQDEAKAGEIRVSLGLMGPYIVLHPVAGTPAKRWPMENWDTLVKSLPEDLALVAIGGEGDRAFLEAMRDKLPRALAVGAGLFSIPVLTAFLKQSRLYIGVDSGPAHLASAVGVPVISLFSGTNRADQWGPRGTRVTLVQKRTDCSPCELAECPFDNFCMRQIKPEEVAVLALKALKV